MKGNDTMNFKIIDLVQGSQDWLNYRRTRIGASEIGTILKGKTNDLISEKIGYGKEHNDFTKKLFADGHAWEDIIRKQINAENPDVQFEPVVIESLHNNRFFASLDGVDRNTFDFIEIKTTSRRAIIEQVMNREVPEEYAPQLAWQCAIIGGFQRIPISGTLYVLDKTTNNMYKLRFTYDANQNHLANAALGALNDLDDAFSFSLSEQNVLNEIYERKKVVAEYQKLIDEEEAKIKFMAENLLKNYNATKLENEFCKIEYSTRKGSVDYSKIQELENVNLDLYRKPDTTFVKITPKKLKVGLPE
jgi:putative phage-type endonuclease